MFGFKLIKKSKYNTLLDMNNRLANRNVDLTSEVRDFRVTCEAQRAHIRELESQNKKHKNVLGSLHKFNLQYSEKNGTVYKINKKRAQKAAKMRSVGKAKLSVVTS